MLLTSFCLPVFSRALITRLLVCLTVFAVAAPVWGQLTFNQIALTGDLAPGASDGAEFAIFGGPSINVSGDVAFNAVLRTGPGGILVNSDNQSSLFGPVSGAGSPLGLIAREGDLAPGVSDGAVFNNLLQPRVNASGEVLFEASLRTGPGGTPVTFNNEAIFALLSGAGSPLGLIVREGDVAPGVSDGAVLGFINPPAFNDSGDVAFEALLRTGPEGTPVTLDNNRAIFGPVSGAGSPLGVIVREGDLAPGVSDGTMLFNLGTPALNASGDVSFSAELGTGADNQSIFGPVSGAGSSLGVVASEGEMAPGLEGAEFGALPNVNNLNDSGDVVFQASLVDTDPGGAVFDIDSAIFGPVSGAGSSLGLIVREGDMAPGLEGAEFVFFGDQDNFFDAPAFNNSGDLAFLGLLDLGPDEEGGAEALFTRIDGEITLIARVGDLVEVSVNGVTEQRTIMGSIFNFSSAFLLEPDSLSDSGELVFGLNFTDGTSGIFTTASPVPEPASAALLALGGITLALRRRRIS